MMIIMAPFLGSFRRVWSVFLKKLMLFCRSVSLFAMRGFCGSSMMITSPPSPVREPPTEVDIIMPWWSLRNSFCRFTSSFRLNLSLQFP